MTDRRPTVAVAIFAKTPGLTPAKTRLAIGAGQATADAFYRRALDITEAVVCAGVTADARLRPYWAVTERAAIGRDCWSSFPQMWQGDGDLGARLAQVYGALLERHAAVLLIGADSPLLTARHLVRALQVLMIEERDFVMGRALDGGFYLFGGRAPIARSLWTTISYSEADTADQLLRLIQPIGTIGQLASLPDVDTLEDLLAIPARAVASGELLPSQRELIEWIGARASA